MIKTHEKLNVNGMNVEVNWSDEVKPCKQIRLTIGNEGCIIGREELYTLLFLFGGVDEQDTLLNLKETKMVLIERLLHIKAKKDIKEGELITVPYQYSMTQKAYDEALRENPRSFRKVELGN